MLGHHVAQNPLDTRAIQLSTVHPTALISTPTWAKVFLRGAVPDGLWQHPDQVNSSILPALLARLILAGLSSALLDSIGQDPALRSVSPPGSGACRPRQRVAQPWTGAVGLLDMPSIPSP